MTMSTQANCFPPGRSVPEGNRILLFTEEEYEPGRAEENRTIVRKVA
jgi:hypothetical protein